MTSWTDLAGTRLDQELAALIVTARDEANAWMDHLLMRHHPDEQAPVHLDLDNMVQALRLTRLLYRQGVIQEEEVWPDLPELKDVLEYLATRRMELMA